MSEQTETSFTIPSDPAARKAILDGIKEISNQWAVVDGYKNSVKDILETLSEKHELPKKYLRRLARTYHNQTFEAQQSENDEFSILYETIVEQKKD